MKRTISITLLVILILGIFCYGANVNESQPSIIDSESEIEAITSLGIMGGYPDGSLGLDRSVTRAEFSKMLTIAAKIPENIQSAFSDVLTTHWAHSYISSLSAYGIVGGFPDKTFRPDDNVTYEQAVKMTLIAFNEGNSLHYPDGYMAHAIDNGNLENIPAIIGRNATRGDIAKLLYNTLVYIEQRDIIESADLTNPLSGSNGVPLQGAPQNSASVAVSGGGSSGGAIAPSSPSASHSTATPGYAPYDYNNFNTEEYTKEDENIFKEARTEPVSTFSIDVDTASYSNMRRFFLNGELPTAGSIRTEELINYFDYSYPLPENGEPFSITTEVASCPWNEKNLLASVAIKGDEIPIAERQPSNIVFLIDTSGSMFSANKLTLVQRAASLLVKQLDERDRVSIVTYAGSSDVALDSASGDEDEKILDALYSLYAFGSTNGASGINLAYELAEKNKLDGNNRIILCTDGDFNIGTTSTAELEELISDKRENGIFLSVLGFGMGNYKDNRVETLADSGNGNYAYIDSFKEAKKVLVTDMMKTLYTIAKDVKIQVEFNPQLISKYRLVGYENRLLNNSDFDDDTKDAGELGAGHTVTALYELIPATDESSGSLRYQQSVDKPSDELMYVKLRYKKPDENESKLLERAVSDIQSDRSENLTFASAVAEFGMLLNNSEFSGSSSYDSILNLADSAKGEDKFGYRSEFIQLVGLAKYLLG